MKRSRDDGGGERAEKRRQLEGLLAQIREQESAIARLKRDRGWLTEGEATPESVVRTWQRIHAQLTAGCPKDAPAGSPPSQPQRRSDEQELRILWKKCETILNNIKRHRLAGPFLRPVDPIRSGVPDYYEVIKNPMDLGTVGKRLEMRGGGRRGAERGYASPLEFRDDMRLVWANCREYNPPGDDCRKLGDQLSQLWEARWAASGIEGRLKDAAGKLQGQQPSEPRQGALGPPSGPDSSTENQAPGKKRAKAVPAPGSQQKVLEKAGDQCTGEKSTNPTKPRPKSATGAKKYSLQNGLQNGLQNASKAAAGGGKLQETQRPAMKAMQHPAAAVAQRKGADTPVPQAASGAGRTATLQEFVSLDKELQKIRAELAKGRIEDKGGFGQLRKLSADIGCFGESALTQIWDTIAKDAAAGAASPDKDVTLDMLSPKTVEKLASVLRNSGQGGRPRTATAPGTNTTSRLQKTIMAAGAHCAATASGSGPSAKTAAVGTDTKQRAPCKGGTTRAIDSTPGSRKMPIGGNRAAEAQRQQAQRIQEIREKEREEREKVEEQKKQDAARRLQAYNEREKQARIANEERRKAEEKLREEERLRAEERKRKEIEEIKNYPRTVDFCLNEKTWRKFEEWGCKPGVSLQKFGFKLKHRETGWVEDEEEEKEEGEI
ncbi:unnamed protein product [Ostreobium quekettii]|uniref:Bromo domain-containing protein n=1 Tax=Ostreobium quekettii TaxID=121088 RepID=A0A8S1IUL6_9CHLO|nr:unnamed protein product [Ostreobium quekettii]